MPNGAFDKRIIKITIEVGGQAYSYSDLAIKVSGEKNTGQSENKATITIDNLKGEVRHEIISSTTPWGSDRVRKRVMVEAGTEETGTAIVFIGDITAASPSQPPDIGLKITAKTNNFMRGKMIAYSGQENDSTKRTAESIAQASGLSVDWQAEEKKIASYSFTGTAAEQIQEINQFGGVECFVDNEQLIVKKRGEPRKGEVRELNMSSGMVGVPEMTEHGVKVKFLFDTKTQIGGLIRIQSKVNSAVNGDYEIYKLNFELTNWEVPWYYIAEAKKYGG